jgi:four helix bundle protein
MKSVEDLDVFKLAHQLALKTYSTTKMFPREETFSLVDQMRRAATSVGMNLMEGAMRLGTKEYRQFVGIARGSAGEVCYQLLLAKDLNYISEDTYRELRSGYDRVLQMLSRLSQERSAKGSNLLLSVKQDLAVVLAIVAFLRLTYLTG